MEGGERGGGEVFQNSPVSLKAAEWGGGGKVRELLAAMT